MTAEAVSVGPKLKFELQAGDGVVAESKILAAEICSIETECVPGKESSIPAGFLFPESVGARLGSSAHNENEDVYVADTKNNRIQEVGPEGKFVLMFGWNVNKTKVEEHAPQSEDNLCTAAEVSSGAKCASGEAGTGQPGQLSQVQDVVLDPLTHDVLVYEEGYHRIEEFTETGEFKLMIGREVNKQGNAEEKNLCTIAESANCQAGQYSAPGSMEPGGFRPESEHGNLIGVCANKLYVGDEGRVQEFSVSSGSFLGELELGASRGFSSSGVVTGLALDGGCNIYVTESAEGVARNTGAPTGAYEFSPRGALLGRFDKSSARIETFALDPFGRMAVIEGPLDKPRGLLIQLSTDKVLSDFAPPGGLGRQPRGVGFNEKGELWVTDVAHQDIELYQPVPVAQVVTEIDPPCKKHPENRLASELKLHGSVNPEGIAETEAWFAYGTKPEELDLKTPPHIYKPVIAERPLEATLTSLTPNTLYYYRGEANDANSSSFGETLSCKTRAIPPLIGCCPRAHTSTSTFASALLEGEIDPENANTEYWFEYVAARACEELEAEASKKLAVNECPGVTTTSVKESSLDELILDQRKITDLQPSTGYRFRFFGTNSLEYEGEPEGGEGPSEQEPTFTTGSAPVPLASTLPASGVGVTSATLAGTVNPGGASATYSFELGIDRGAATEYGTVVSGSAGKGSAPVEERYGVAGLQSGTAYLYRMTVHNGYGVSYGASVEFQTEGLPVALKLPSVLGQLPTPAVHFPKTPKSEPRSGGVGRLAKALKACRKKRGRQRRVCERKARRKHGSAGKARPKH